MFQSPHSSNSNLFNSEQKDRWEFCFFSASLIFSWLLLIDGNYTPYSIITDDVLATCCWDPCIENAIRSDDSSVFWYNRSLTSAASLRPYVVWVHSATERRSRLLFMRQWSQVGHSKKRSISREELEKWAESLNALLASQSKSCLVLR